MGEPRANEVKGGRSGPLPRWLGRVAEPFYRAAIGRRNAAFDAGRGVVRLGVPVISVGNLSVGGTGKTPMVMHIVGVLRRAGRKPCIAMRGYRRGPVPPDVRSGTAGADDATMPHRLSPRAATSGGTSDEVDVYARAFPDLPIVAQVDRAAGLRVMMSERPGAFDCVVLDDGFQHRKIARELDLVLIDATRPPERDRLLPAGWLREPVGSLRRASGVVITHAECVGVEELASLKRFVEREHGKPVLAVTRHLWTGLVGSRSGEGPRPLDVLAGKRVFAACAIGNPGAFVRTLEMTVGGLGGRVVGTMVLGDHDPYVDATVERLIREARREKADAIVVTDKDWSKLRQVGEDRWPAEVFRPVLTMAFDEGVGELERAVLGAVGG